MRKIPTLFRRDPDDMRHVLPEVTPGCEWVLNGEGVATRKYDGICVRCADDGTWWARREVKPGKQPPYLFDPVDYDEATGKTVGWEPYEQTGWARYVDEAIDHHPTNLYAGTYEMCGPKVNGNPEGYDTHTLVSHDNAEIWPVSRASLTFPLLRDIVVLRGERGWEGLVWHHPDGRMAKLKARDFT
jgi:hypothetical protein